MAPATRKATIGMLVRQQDGSRSEQQQNQSVASASTVEIHSQRNRTMEGSDALSKQESRRSIRSGRSSRSHQQQQQQHRKPVDLDDLKFDDSEDSSDASVGDVTETSVSRSSTAEGVVTVSSVAPQEDNRMSALVHTMAAKQQGISETFCEMINKMSKMMVHMEEQMVLHMDCAQDDETAANRAKSKAHRSVQRALEMRESALAMKAKQARIAQQFETLVHRLEQETIETTNHNQSLKRQLQMAKVLLKDEAGVEMEDISQTASSLHAHSASGRPPHTPRSKSSKSSSSRRPPLLRKAGSVRSAHSSPEKGQASPMHPIREIAFANTVVDVTEMRQAAAAAEREEDEAASPLVLKESGSSESPVSRKTAGTSASVTTTSSDNLRIIL